MFRKFLLWLYLENHRLFITRKDPINLKSIPPPRILRESVQRHLMFIKFGRNASDSNGKSYKIISNVNLLNENNLFF